MAASRWLVLPLVVAAWAVGCEDERAAEPRQEQTPAEVRVDEAREAAKRAPVPPRPAPPVIRIEVHGTVHVNGAPAVGESVPIGARVETRESSRAVLTVVPSARLELEQDTIARVDSAAPFAVVIARGRGRATLPPAGNEARQPLRVGTPEGTAEIGGSGDVVVAVDEDGSAYFAVLSGRAEVGRGELGEEDRPVELEVLAGRAVTLRGGLPAEPLAGPTRMENVDEVVGAAFASPRATPAPDVAALAADVDALVAELGREAERGDALAESHPAAAERSAEEASAVQREIVRHSQRVLRLRAALRTRWERLVGALEARRAAGDLSADPVAERAERVRRALGDVPH